MSSDSKSKAPLSTPTDRIWVEVLTDGPQPISVFYQSDRMYLVTGYDTSGIALDTPPLTPPNLLGIARDLVVALGVTLIGWVRR